MSQTLYLKKSLIDHGETEWETTQNFYDFLSTPGFQSHGAEVVTHFTAPPQLQIYNTDLSPKAVFSSHLTEVFRIEVGADHSTIDAVRDTWSEFITVIEQILPNVPSLSGTSLNLDQQLFLGVIGWKASEVSNRKYYHREVHIS